MTNFKIHEHRAIFRVDFYKKRFSQNILSINSKGISIINTVYSKSTFSVGRNEFA